MSNYVKVFRNFDQTIEITNNTCALLWDRNEGLYLNITLNLVLASGVRRSIVPLSTQKEMDAVTLSIEGCYPHWWIRLFTLNSVLCLTIAQTM